MPGLDPGIHSSSKEFFTKGMDGRVIQREETRFALLPGHDK
jgi:hypothetical protein